jgi:hypothetical protein
MAIHARTSRASALCVASAFFACAGLAHAGSDEIFRSGFEAAGPGFFPDGALTGADVSVANAAGRTAMIYAGGGSGGTDAPIRYGECTGGCADPASWHFATLGSYGAAGLGGGPRMSLDRAGHPRVLWYSQATVGGAGELYYGECNAASCATLASWTITPIVEFSNGDSMALLARGAFALDREDRPRFFVQDLLNGTFYGACDAGCTSAGNWSFTPFTSIPANVDLEFDANNRARVAFENPSPNIIDGEDLYYAACDANCASESSWQVLALIAVNDNLVAEPFALALDAAGAPRIAFYYDASGANALAYAWCDADCASGAPNSWNAFTTGLPAYSGRKGVALALDAADVPHLAYGGSTDGIADDSVNLAVCSGGCDTQPSWQPRQIASIADLTAPPPDPCGTGLSRWQIGTAPDLALEGGTTHFAFDTYSYFSCITGYDDEGNPIYTVDAYTGPVGYVEP